jgi:hypothetical protein
MPYTRSDGTFANVRDVVLLPAQVLTVATVNGTGLETGGASGLRVAIVTGTVSGGSPSLALHVQTSIDNGVSDAWRDVPSTQPAAITTATTVRYSCAGLDRWVRVSAVVTGTGQFAASSVVGELVPA